MYNDVKNSSGKIIGFVEVDNVIIVCSFGRPTLTINNKNDVQRIKNKDLSLEFLAYLYDTYYLMIGEIAALYGVCYSNINKLMKRAPYTTSKHAGRRNRAFNHPVSQKQSAKMSNALCGRKNTYYERTSDIRNRISHTLKQYFKEHPQNPDAHRANWANGKYDAIDFHHGIGGSMFSLKNNCSFFFRSLFELWYMLQMETDDSISAYKFEPFHILCDDGSYYTPDFLINNLDVVELKSKKYLESLPAEQYSRFEYKVEQATKYCEKHELTYRVVYDIDVDFDSRRTKRHFANHPELIEKYNIKFNQPNRMVFK